MYHLHHLESLDDARLDVFARMTDVQLRSRIEPERGVFIAETAFCRPRELTVAEAVRGARLIAVLENIRNHTNVGAIFRSAAAIGADAVLVSPACYDPLYRRAVRVSMGTVFQIPWARIGSDVHDWARDGVPLLHDLGFTAVALALSNVAFWELRSLSQSCAQANL